MRKTTNSFNHNKNTTYKVNNKNIEPQIPLSLKLVDYISDELPVIVDETMYARRFKVEPGKTYASRIGIYANPVTGVGAFPKDSVAFCNIPTATSKEIVIMGFFTCEEIFPVVFLDSIVFYSDKPFTLNYKAGSAAFVSIGNPEKITLQNNTIVHQENDAILIEYCNSKADAVKCRDFTYDFLTFEVEVVSANA